MRSKSFLLAESPHDLSQAKKTQKGKKRRRSLSVNCRALRGRRRTDARSLKVQQVKELMLSLQAIVVNLERRPDRLVDFRERAQKSCPWLQWTRFDASDGKRDTIAESDVVYAWNTSRNVVYQKLRSERLGWDDLHTYKVMDLTLTPGERGCAMSHVRAWRHCLDVCGDSNAPLLVLEDDAAPIPEFTDLLERALTAVPDDAHVVYLGYEQASNWKREVSANLVESQYVWTTVAYLVYPAGARLMLSSLPVTGPVDNWMALLCADGPMKSYCVRPDIVKQAEAWNVNSDVGHSDEHYCGGPDSDIVHSDHLYWGNTHAAAQAGDEPLGPRFFDMGSEDSEDSDA